MRVIITAGGTGGHIYPALSFIEHLEKVDKKLEILYIGTHNRMESKIIPGMGMNYKKIRMYGIDRKNPFKNIKTVFCLISSQIIIKKTIKEFNPDYIVGFGGYVTYPVIKVGKKLGHKVFLHEQNSLMGKVNQKLSKVSDATFLSLPLLKENSEGEFYLVGNPAASRAKTIKKSSLIDYNFKNKKTVLIVMGSLGSESVNNYLEKQIKVFGKSDYNFIIITGERNYKGFKKTRYKNIKILPYYNNLVSLMKSVDLIVTRAGATTLSEIIAVSKPSIIIPSRYVVDNHQYYNAKILADKKAALMLEEKDIEELYEKISEILNNKDLIVSYKKNLEKLDLIDPAKEMYTIIREKLN